MIIALVPAGAQDLVPAGARKNGAPEKTGSTDLPSIAETRALTEHRCNKAQSVAVSEIKALPELGNKVRDGQPLRVVAFGSSSTEGTPGMPQEAIFPSVFGRELAKELHTRVDVINKGKGGDTIPLMMMRFERDVVAQKPDLVIWQLGTNDVLQMDGVDGSISLMKSALEQLDLRHLPVVLVDLQSAPMVNRDKDTPVMQAAIDAAGRKPGVLHFHRQALMNRLIEDKVAQEPELVAKDGLHMTVLAHFCTGKLLAGQVAGASRITQARR